MDNLNDDCLCMIFRLLPLREQVILARCSERYQNIIVGCLWCRVYREIHTTQPIGVKVPNVSIAYRNVAELDKENYEAFYQMNVQNVERLHISGNLTRHAFSSYLGRYLQRPDLTFYLTFQYLGLIEFICSDRTLHDGHIRLLAKNCPQLRSVQISSQHVSGEHLNGLHQLRRLSAANCTLDKCSMDKFIANATMLNYLDIRWNKHLIDYPLVTWGSSLYELHLSEEIFHGQFYKQSLPERLGNIKLLSIVCDIKPTTPISDYGSEMLRKEWLSFFQFCGNRVKVIKMLFNSQAILDALENIYFTTYEPVFPNMMELHLKLKTPGNRLKPLFSAKQLRSLFIYTEDYYGEIVKLIQSCPTLVHLHIEHAMINLVKVADFIRNVNRWLNNDCNSRDVCLHLKELTDEPIRIRRELEEHIGYDLYSPVSHLKVEISSGNKSVEQHWGRLDFEFF